MENRPYKYMDENISEHFLEKQNHNGVSGKCGDSSVPQSAKCSLMPRKTSGVKAWYLSPWEVPMG